MAVVVHVNRSARLVTSTFSGRIVLDDFIRGRQQTAADGAWLPTFRHLIDLRDVDEVAIEGAQLEALAAMPTLFDANVLQVVVALEGTAVYGIVRMYQAAARPSPRNVHLVTMIDKAHALLSG